uniref:Uncharacterized protein n=1 Tax=Clastoptera arizonana TaxID=38151 RepID=A0A1B6E974_9HEMI
MSDDYDDSYIKDMKRGLGHYWQKLTKKPKVKVETWNVKPENEAPFELKPSPANWPQPTFYVRQYNRNPRQQQARPQTYQKPMQKSHYNNYDYKRNSDTLFHTPMPRRSYLAPSTVHSIANVDVVKEEETGIETPIVTFASKYELRRFKKFSTRTTSSWKSNYSPPSWKSKFDYTPNSWKSKSEYTPSSWKYKTDFNRNEQMSWYRAQRNRNTLPTFSTKVPIRNL